MVCCYFCICDLECVMESIKVKVSNEAESKEVQGYFEELGFKKVVWGLFTHNNYFIFSNADYYSRDSFINFSECDYKEITLPQLRDMVVLKRNDAGNATHINFRTNTPFLVQDSKEYFYLNNKWILSDSVNDLKPIKEKEMKEFLVSHDNKWTLRLLDSDTEENSYRVAVPSGATHYSEGKYSGKAVFFKVDSINQYEYYDDVWLSRRYPLNEMYFTTQLLWQRSGTESLNDQYAEIEKVRQETIKITIDELKHRVGVDATLAERQATYGSFEDVAFVTENVMGVLSKARPNGLSDLPHTHRMALYMIVSKMARIVNGDFNHLDSWHDIGGYAKLIENLIGDEDE